MRTSQTFCQEYMTMDSLKPLFQGLSLFLLIFLASSVSAKQLDLPRLGTLTRTIDTPAKTLSSSDLKDFKTFYYTQTLDHFNYKPESYTTFKQRYVINSKYWGGANASAPIFAYLGAEAPIDSDLIGVGFLTDNAARFSAYLVYIEHRYYGKSVPFGSRQEAFKNASTRGYFNSAQAIADYAAVLIQLKKKLSAKKSPIVVFGASYGGMLASWFRLKYPHVAVGALASSAPILYFDNITPQDGYYSVVSKDFREFSESCYKTIKTSWAEIDKVASQPNGLTILSNRFKTCHPLNKSSVLVDYLDSVYTESAQYNSPSFPRLTMVCSGIDGSPKGTDILGRIFAGVVALRGNKTCHDINEYSNPTETSEGWRWQTCSEMVMPIAHGNSKDSMFPAATFDLRSFNMGCKSLYGVMPRPHWVTTYYGGHDIKSILHNFASNIIFSNGLKDPYSSGGVLENISESVVAVTTVNGSHCLDILRESPSDPEWLVEQRKIEVEIIKVWITEY